MARPEGRSRALLRDIAAKQKQFQQHRLYFRNDGVTQPLAIRTEDRARRDLVAGGIGMGGCSEGGGHLFCESAHRALIPPLLKLIGVMAVVPACAVWLF